ncbi:MAG: type IV secretion protein IcmL [Micavibrio sp.]|nr:type IV secretion protein IcmL [Micavibrio sp.]|tara:strand:+ start:298 stop:1017 length:720 start_codon:yes stop_codon:yes gene_type:complete
MASQKQKKNQKDVSQVDQVDGAEEAVADAQPEDTSGLGRVVIRNEFYRDGYRSLLKLALIQGVVIIFMIGIVFAIVQSREPENRYFATTEDGRLVPMVPLNQPNLSAPALMSWSAQAVTQVMTFGFNDYRTRLQEASNNFTKRGWESFTQALQRSRIIELVEAKQQVVTAAPTGAPIIVNEGLIAGRYQWQIQIPIVLSYQAGAQTRSDNLLVTLVVVRVPRLESPNGVGIEQWIARPR